MKKIAIITEFYHPHLGGVELRFKEIAEEFILMGYSVDIYTIKYDMNIKNFECIDGVNVHRIVEDFQYKSGNGLKNRSLSTILEFSIKSINILNKNNYLFVVFSHLPILPIFCAKLFTRNIVKCLDFVEFRYGFKWKIIQRLLAFSSDKVIFISKSIQQNFLQQTKFNKSVAVIPSLVNIKNFKTGEPEHILFIGRLEEHKHPENAVIATLEYNRKYFSDLSIHLVGSGKLLTELAQKYNNNSKVIFHGYTSENKKVELLEKAFCLILPSEREGLPKSVIEAVAAEIPTITTDYIGNGTKDFIRENDVGIVVLPEIELIVDGINTVIKNISYYRERCKTVKINFDLRSGAKNYMEIGLRSNEQR